MLSLFENDPVSAKLGRSAARLPDELVGLPEQGQIPNEPDIRLQHDRQFLAPHVAHAHSVRRRSIVTEGADHVDRELVFPAQQMVIEFPAEGILIARGQVLDLAVPKDRVEGKGFQLLADLGRIDIQRLDLSLDVLLFVCQEFVDLAITLNVGFALETRQSVFDLSPLSRLVSLEFRQQKNADVAYGRLEFLHILDKEQCLQNANREGIVEVPLGNLDGLLDGGL